MVETGRKDSREGTNEEEFGVWIGATHHLLALLTDFLDKDAEVVADSRVLR